MSSSIQYTVQLLQFIIDQKKDLGEYMSLVPLLREKFTITKPGFGATDHTEILIRKVIDWENHPGTYDSLEKTLNDLFYIRLKEA